MRAEDLEAVYASYLSCLNDRSLDRLGVLVTDDVAHNGRALGLSGYRAMLERNFEEIPDLRFQAQLRVVGPPHVAVRLWFECTPRAEFLGLPVNGTKVAFAEHAMYRFVGSRIAEVWSIIDRAAIEQQLRPST